LRCAFIIRSYQHFTLRVVDYLNRHGIKAERDNGCKGINAMVELNQLAFTAQPIPVLARVDLAAIFLHRQSLLDTNLLFGKHILSPDLIRCFIIALLICTYHVIFI
jgi:hypothetical protein